MHQFQCLLSFFLDINFITAGKTLGSDGVATSLNLNLSNKILIISSIIFFRVTNFIFYVDYKKMILFFKKK